jgi:hypothetical protein
MRQLTRGLTERRWRARLDDLDGLRSGGAGHVSVFGRKPRRPGLRPARPGLRGLHGLLIIIEGRKHVELE